MAILEKYRETREDVLIAAMQTLQLATLMTQTETGFEFSHVPMLVKKVGDDIFLEGHVARSNSHWKVADVGPSAAIFQGPHAYVSPSWYPSKQEHGKVVPTWNYLAVHAHGQLEAVDDQDFLLEQLKELTQRNEDTRAQPWTLSDAPDKYIPALSRGIVGLRFRIERLEGVWKMSQNRSEADIQGVVDGLSAEGEGAADVVANVVKSINGYDAA